MRYLGKSKLVKSPLTHLQNFVGLLINMFLQLSHCFSEPVIYRRNQAILIICHPFLMIDKKTWWECCNNTYELSNEDTSQFSQEYVPNHRLGCGHSEKERDSFPMMKNWCALCLKRYVIKTNARDCLKYPICLQLS